MVIRGQKDSTADEPSRNSLVATVATDEHGELGGDLAACPPVNKPSQQLGTGKLVVGQGLIAGFQF